ncbi:MAG TPA: hypothetical protein PLD48_08795 [Bacillota bacterium]|nr:hypothetical protein [Bacillota bacterium]HOK69477.1 hypothetical protein [Bacillota bacterium]HPP86085.1 hypothetical protein [Bacillota bacterium]
MAERGAYYTLFSTQAKRYIAPADESVRIHHPSRPDMRPPRPDDGSPVAVFRRT